MLSSKQRMIKNVVLKACETQSIVYREGVIRLLKKYGNNEPDERDHLLVRKDYFDAVCNKTIDVLGGYYFDAEDEIRDIVGDPGIIGLDDCNTEYGMMAGWLFVVCCAVYDKKPLRNFVDAIEINHYQNDVMTEVLRFIDEHYSLENCGNKTNEGSVYENDDSSSFIDDGKLAESNDGIIYLYELDENTNCIVISFDGYSDILGVPDSDDRIAYASYIDDYYTEDLLDNGWTYDDDNGWWINDNNETNIEFAIDLINKYDEVADELKDEYDSTDDFEEDDEDNNLTLKESLWMQVTEYMDRMEIPYSATFEGTMLRYTVSGLKSKIKKAECNIWFDKWGYTVYAVSPFEADLDDIEEMMKFLHMANSGMIRSNFEIDLENGIIRLKTRYDTYWAPQLTDEVMHNSIYGSANVLDDYGNGIIALSMGFSNAEEEIRKVEGPFETEDQDDEFVPEPFTAIDKDIPF